MLQILAHLVSPALLRLVCKDWRDSVDRSISSLTPATCHAETILEVWYNITELDFSEAGASVSDECLGIICHLGHLRILNLQGCAKVHLQAPAAQPSTKQAG